MMKKFIYLTVVLMIGFMLIGCSGMSAEQRKGESDLTSSVGNKQFVGDPSPESHSLSRWTQMSGY
jgi:ABC-type phosphate/phosphonate transport system substrate-binding protein